MDKHYHDLFSLITQQVANLAERVIKSYKENEKDSTSVEQMRDDFLNLHNKIQNDEDLIRVDYARLFVGAYIISEHLSNQIREANQVLEGYKNDILPKLDQINHIMNEEEAHNLAMELFKVSEKN